MPGVPQSFSVNPKPPDCAKLTWTAPSGPEPDHYEVVALPTMTLHTSKASPLEICGLEHGATYSFELRAVAADGKSDPEKVESFEVTPPTPSMWWWITSYVLTALFIAAGVVSLLLNWSAHTRHGVAFACGIVAIGLLILSVTGGKLGIWRAVIGKDGRVSTSYLTTGLWTLLVAFALAYMTSRAWFHDEKHLFEGFTPGGNANASKPPQIWDDYLVLLGGPFAALVFARGIVATKVENQTIQKTVVDDGTASLKQSLTDDSGSLDLVDSQYLLFNIVALAYVIVGLATTTFLPVIPPILLALTSSSAATYVVNKAVQNEQPTVAAVNPSSFRAGERIVITGTNLMPAGRNRPPVVSIAGKQALVEAGGTGSRVTAIVPPGVSTGVQQLIVTTAARAATEARTVEILADQPQILMVEPPVPMVGRPMAIRGVGFTSALDPTPTCTVTFDGGHPQAAVPRPLPSSLEEVTVTPPPGTPKGQDVAVVVRTPRLTSSPAVDVTFR